jgi:UDP-N-acetylmuramoyl-tripeptide--D-alanyl-D-alanine ligase
VKLRALSEVSQAIGGTLRGHDARVTSVVTDSRVAQPGALFFALRGEHADGHDFVADALARGAAGAVVSRPEVDGPVVEVADTGRALIDLAADERQRMPEVRVIGITGANGKTSTKDLAAAVLSTRFPIHASPASYNNEIGLPVTVLGTPEGTEVVVAEMGARREGDVALLCRVARPDAVVVTNVGVAHMEIFGSWDAIVRASAEPVDALGPDGLAILNIDDDVVRSYLPRVVGRLLTFGMVVDADVRAEEVTLDDAGRASFVLSVADEREPVQLAVSGEHMVSNALAAAACGVAFGLSAVECATALKGAQVSAWRMEAFVSAGGVSVVNDAYNANPESMAAGLKAARWMARDGRLIAVLGHMAELGAIALDEHDKLGELIVRIGVDRLITVGKTAGLIARAAVREGQLPEDVASYNDVESALAAVRASTGPGDVVFIKGSRVVGLERLAEALR